MEKIWSKQPELFQCAMVILVFLVILKKIFVSHQRCSTDLDVSNFVLT